MDELDDVDLGVGVLAAIARGVQRELRSRYSPTNSQQTPLPDEELGSSRAG